MSALSGVDDMGEIARTRSGDASTQRDELGFETGEQPNLSLSQVMYLLTFATHGDAVHAGEATGITDEQFAAWMSDDGFRNILDAMLRNKREGVKQIGAQLLPLMLLEITKIMLSGTNKDKLTAAKLHAQMQGLLITQTAPIDKGVLEQIRAELLRPRPIIRTLPSGS